MAVRQVTGKDFANYLRQSQRVRDTVAGFGFAPDMPSSW